MAKTFHSFGQSTKLINLQSEKTNLLTQIVFSQMSFIDTSTLIHSRLINYWKNEHESYRQSRHFMQSRFDRAAKGLGEGQKCSGDLILERLTDLFLNGFGVVWSPVQVTIFHALVDSILPRIYLNEWEDVKTRVMNQRGLDRLHQETLVNMGRLVISWCCL